MRMLSERPWWSEGVGEGYIVVIVIIEPTEELQLSAGENLARQLLGVTPGLKVSVAVDTVNDS